MFDFEKLDVYIKAKLFNKSIASFLRQTKVDKVTHDQLRRASFSIMLNIAEGVGRFAKKVVANSMVIIKNPTTNQVRLFKHFFSLKFLILVRSSYLME